MLQQLLAYELHIPFYKINLGEFLIILFLFFLLLSSQLKLKKKIIFVTINFIALQHFNYLEGIFICDSMISFNDAHTYILFCYESLMMKYENKHLHCNNDYDDDDYNNVCIIFLLFSFLCTHEKKIKWSKCRWMLHYIYWLVIRCGENLALYLFLKRLTTRRDSCAMWGMMRCMFSFFVCYCCNNTQISWECFFKGSREKL